MSWAQPRKLCHSYTSAMSIPWAQASQLQLACESSTPEACRKLITPPDQPAKPSLYPRIDPAVIMAVTAGDHILLGHQSRWVDGRYSLLAGVETDVHPAQMLYLTSCITVPVRPR